ncbi:MAG: CHASE domain-containing protein [Planctomycetota bacterium]|nr:CHASE domain-containing protein [Planctomycetota bacterium]
MVPAAHRAEYFPAYYVEPTRGNEWVIGFDLASDKERHDALNRSMDLGKAVATAPVDLVQVKEQSRGFLLFYPIYKQNMMTPDVETRRRNLGGFALGVFQVSDTVSMAMRIVERNDINVQISDDETPDATKYLHRHWAESAQPDDYENASVLHQQTVLVGGRSWTCMASPSSGYLKKRQTWNPIATALIGVGVSLFLAGYLTEKERAAHKLQRLNESLEQRVAERTREVEDRNRELARSNESLSQFAYVASHDLQEPLRAVHGYAEILSGRYSKQLDEKAKVFIGNILDGVDRMKTLISGLLNYSRIGGVQEPFTKFETSELIEQVSRELEVSIKESGAEVIHNGLPSLIAERTQLGQLFQNLVSNGIKFRNSGRPVVEVSAVRSENASYSVETLPPGWVFSVRDNGIGIEPQYLDSVFIIFKRLHTRTDYRGTGIGLAICKRVVEYHNGRIWVESVPGQGTTFFFDIPDRELA